MRGGCTVGQFNVELPRRRCVVGIEDLECQSVQCDLLSVRQLLAAIYQRVGAVEAPRKVTAPGLQAHDDEAIQFLQLNPCANCDMATTATSNRIAKPGERWRFVLGGGKLDEEVLNSKDSAGRASFVPASAGFVTIYLDGQPGIGRLELLAPPPQAGGRPKQHDDDHA